MTVERILGSIDVRIQPTSIEFVASHLERSGSVVGFGNDPLRNPNFCLAWIELKSYVVHSEKLSPRNKTEVMRAPGLSDGWR